MDSPDLTALAEGPWRQATLVRELLTIYAGQEAPSHIWEKQVDGRQAELEGLLRLRWYDFGPVEWNTYLADLAFARVLQPDLLTFLLPAVLSIWAEGLATGDGRPQPYFYVSVSRKEVWSGLDDGVARATLDWMARAFVGAVDLWSDRLSWEHAAGWPDARFYLRALHAVGKSVPICDRILRALTSVTSAGRLQFWYVAGTTLAYREGEAPANAPSTREGATALRPAGGIYLANEASMKGPFLPANLSALARYLTPEAVAANLRAGLELRLRSSLRDDAEALLGRISENREQVRASIELYLKRLSENRL